MLPIFASANVITVAKINRILRESNKQILITSFLIKMEINDIYITKVAATAS